MLPYWVLFLVPAGMALLPVKFDKNINNILWAMACLHGILMIGLRYQVGGDWDPYLVFLDSARGVDLSIDYLLDASYGNATGYVLLNWAVSQLGLGAEGIYVVNTFCGTIFMVGLVKYCRKQPIPWVALAVAIPYLVTAVSMGYSRQAVALGFFLWGLSILREGNELKYFALLILGSFFHLSVLIMLPLMLFARDKVQWWFYPFIGGFFVTIGYMFFSIITPQFGNLVENYSIILEYTATRYSAGAEIRTYLNATPVLFALFFWKRIKKISTDHKIIKWMSIASLIAIPAMSVGATLIDRLGLYLMPLQVALWPRIIAVQRNQMDRAMWLAMVIVFYAIVLYVWLNFAIHAYAWLPYRFFPISNEPIYPFPENM